MSGRLAGRVAAITGSSRGIGRAVATAFLAEGAKVAVNSRDQAVADQVARELGARAVGVGADVATEAGAAALVGGAVDAFGRLDVLVNNAGITVAAHTLELDLNTWQKVIDLNMTAVSCARAKPPVTCLSPVVVRSSTRRPCKLLRPFLSASRMARAKPRW